MVFLPVWLHRQVIEVLLLSVTDPAGISFTSRSVRGLEVTQRSSRHPTDVPQRYTRRESARYANFLSSVCKVLRECWQLLSAPTELLIIVLHVHAQMPASAVVNCPRCQYLAPQVAMGHLAIDLGLGLVNQLL